MRRTLIAATLVGVLLSGWALPAGAQNNGIVIQNNGVDSSDSAAGADNVSISNNPGAAQSSSGGGVNNEDVQGARAPRERKDRGARNTAEAAPVEAAAPAEGDLQGFTDGGEYVDPAAAPVEVAQPADAEPVALQLPNTGSGVASASPLAAALAAFVAFVALTAGAMSLRRRLAG